MQAAVAREFRIENKHVFIKKIVKQSRRVLEGNTRHGDEISEIRAAVMREKFTRLSACLESKTWNLDIVYSINLASIGTPNTTDRRFARHVEIPVGGRERKSYRVSLSPPHLNRRAGVTHGDLGAKRHRTITLMANAWPKAKYASVENG